MAQWLQKILGLPEKKQGDGKSLTERAPANAVVPSKGNPLVKQIKAQSKSLGRLPNAVLIYGATACVLFAVSVYHFSSGRFLTGGVVFFIACCFLGFAYLYANYASRS